MSKNSHKNKENILHEERMREVAREFDFGSGSEVFIKSHKDKNDKKGRITYFFSSQLPKINLGLKTTKKQLEVECSSVDLDNQSLLHYLFKRNKS